MAPVDALHLKRMLFEDLDGRHLIDMLDVFVRTSRGSDDDYDVLDMAAAKAAGIGRPIPDRNPRFAPHVEGVHVAMDLQRWLRAGECFYVAPQMMDLAIAASESMPDEVIVMEDIPIMQGFMWLPSPLRFMDIRGQVMSANAVVWSVQGGGAVFFFFTDKNDPVDMINAGVRKRSTPAEWAQMPRLSVATTASIRFGDVLPRQMSNATLLPSASTVDLSWQTDKEGRTNMVFVSDVSLDLQPKVQRDPLLAAMLTIFRLTQQSIASVEHEQAPRALVRQMHRANLPDKHVTVIQLRRRTGGSDGHTQVEWTHQWLVRGHWRNQPCKVDGVASHRWIYIHPYIKGPEGAPLLVRDKVYALLR